MCAQEVVIYRSRSLPAGCAGGSAREGQVYANVEERKGKGKTIDQAPLAFVLTIGRR